VFYELKLWSGVRGVARLGLFRAIRENDLTNEGEFFDEFGLRFSRAALTKSGLEGETRPLSQRIPLARHFSDVVLSPNRRGGYLIKGDSIVVPQSLDPAVPRLFFPGTRVGGVLGQKAEKVLVKKTDLLAIKYGVFCGSLAPYNWYHWTIDYLAAVWRIRNLPREFDNFPLIVPEFDLGRSSFLEALEKVLGPRKIEWVNPEGHYRVSSLVRVSGLTTPAPRSLQEPTGGRVWFDCDGIREFRKHQLESFGVDDGEIIATRRLFLVREGGSRDYNEHEIWAIAKRFGFVRVSLEGLTLGTSMQLFRSAELVVGPHGAGWADFIYCSRATRALIFSWKDQRGDNWYENVAMISDGSLNFLLYDESRMVGKDPRNSQHYLSPKKFERELERLAGAK